MNEYTASRLVNEMHELNRTMRAILHHLNGSITGGSVRRTGDLPMKPLVPGTTATYVVTPTPIGAPTIPSGSGWISSDPINAPVTVEADGLTATVTVPAVVAPVPTLDAPVPFTLTWTYTNLDGSQDTASFEDKILAPVEDVTGGTIARTA